VGEKANGEDKQDKKEKEKGDEGPRNIIAYKGDKNRGSPYKEKDGINIVECVYRNANAENIL